MIGTFDTDDDDVELFMRVRPTQLWVDEAELQDNGVTLDEIAEYIAGLTANQVAGRTSRSRPDVRTSWCTRRRSRAGCSRSSRASRRNKVEARHRMAMTSSHDTTRSSRLGSAWVIGGVVIVLLLLLGWRFLADPSLSAPTRDPAWYTWRAQVVLD